ncbi:MAG TPA: ferritin-like domain-containing protein [Acidimicrobiales bacterium]|nr:ferritin-like domain-containing protein [Acidimicrobiales bacterium]
MRTTIDSYKARAGRLNLEGIDFDDFRHEPLSPAALRTLRYMHDVEHHTVCYLRDLLLTPAHLDPEITSFLSCWVFEELWHGEALAQVLEAHGELAGAPRVADLRRRHRRQQVFTTLNTLGSAALAGKAFVALHMTWGAINEWTTQAGYSRLAELAGHPTLRELLRRIMKQEGGHIDFYASEATRRLGASTKAQRLTRFALARFWRPVGSGVMPHDEVGFLTRYLFDGSDGHAVVARIDRRVDMLPGLDNLNLLHTAVSRLARPPAQFALCDI